MNSLTQGAIVSSLVLATFGCGGIGDTADEDHRIITIVHSDFPDGTEVEERIVGEIDRNFDRDVDIEGPWIAEGEDLGNGYGRARQAFNYGASFYGHLDTIDPFAADGRCPASWSSPSACRVPGVKSFMFYSFLESDAGDGVPNAALQTEFTQALGYMNGKGGFAFAQGDPHAGDVMNAWVENELGVCSGGAVACTGHAYGSVFTSGGSRFRKTVPHFGFGWPGMTVMVAINIDPDVVVQQTFLGTPAQRSNYAQNIIEHEMAHAMGLAHNPAGSTTRSPLQTATAIQDPGTVLTASEIAGAAAYQP